MMPFMAPMMMGAGGGALWTPAQFGNALQGWWDAQDAATLTTASGAVSAWADKSGKGRTMSQATAAQRPALLASGIGGKPALQFDGSNDTLRTDPFSAGQPFSALVVYNPGAASTYNFMVSFDPVSESTQSLIIPSSGQTSGSASLYAGGYALFGSAQTGADTMIAAVFNGSASVGSQNGTAATLNPNTNGISTGVGLSSNVVSGGQYTGLIGELIVTSGAMSTADRQKAEGYAAWRWGFQGKLPAGHPYKSAPPTV